MILEMSPFITCIYVSTHFRQSSHERSPHFVSYSEVLTVLSTSSL